jgi:prepilin peptidase CpaA
LSSIGDVSLGLCLGLVIIAAGWDIRTRRIPNLLNALIAVAAIAATYLNGSPVLLGMSALHALIALVVGMGLFAVGFIGAGDAKMYSAVGFAIPLPNALEMLGWTSVAGLAVLIATYVTRRVAGKPISKDGKSFTVPYGAAIATGLWLTILI